MEVDALMQVGEVVVLKGEGPRLIIVEIDSGGKEARCRPTGGPFVPGPGEWFPLDCLMSEFDANMDSKFKTISGFMTDTMTLAFNGVRILLLPNDTLADPRELGNAHIALRVDGRGVCVVKGDPEFVGELIAGSRMKQNSTDPSLGDRTLPANLRYRKTQ